MSTQYSHTVLFVDDEVQSQKYFSKIFGKLFPVMLADDGDVALEIFREHQDEIGLVVSDQRMPNVSGSQFLAKVSGIKPDVVRILSTAYSDLDAAVDAVNEGGIYRYVTKPWDIPELEVTLRRAMEYYELKLQNRELSNSKISGLQQLQLYSRLMAAAAIPELLHNDQCSVQAVGDLITLALQEKNSPSNFSQAIGGLSSESDRATLVAGFVSNLKDLLQRSQDQASSPLAAENLFRTSPNETSPAAQAFSQLLVGNASGSDMIALASVLAHYRSGKRIDCFQSPPVFCERPQGSANPFDALCELFLGQSVEISDYLDGSDSD